MHKTTIDGGILNILPGDEDPAWAIPDGDGIAGDIAGNGRVPVRGH